MKTTLDLPEDLHIAAKQVAVEQGTTLKDLVIRCLRREIGLANSRQLPPDSSLEVGPLGILRRRKRRQVMTPTKVQELIENDEQGEMDRALLIRRGKNS